MSKLLQFLSIFLLIHLIFATFNVNVAFVCHETRNWHFHIEFLNATGSLISRSATFQPRRFRFFGQIEGPYEKPSIMSIHHNCITKSEFRAEGMKFDLPYSPEQKHIPEIDNIGEITDEFTAAPDDWMRLGESREK
ncbi:unnamed protein product [Caenorhabditis angaria]|uniref:Uncharacterized protein n=1 Tax=Caenorhabditis angaria TaxID=860376 RepID=A0A9P1IEH4_9PELO|nr:unnamed protein product [Caenorhabditis angaria]